MYFLFFSFFVLLTGISLLMAFYLLDYSSLCIEISLPFYYIWDMSLTFSFDFLSCFFFSVISLISSVVFIYSKFYMDDDFSFYSFLNSRFFYLLFLFVISMMFLVFSNSWVSLLLGWDGLGIVSFLLVIYYNNFSSVNSGLLTIFVNRLGDCFFIFSFIFMGYYGWFEFGVLSQYTLVLGFMAILIGVVTKSAQFPFSSWLPAAMAAPTPVSSLVHSSTLVTAGVYLMIRFNFLLESVFPLLMFVSLFTMVLGGICAFYELDFKKVVAMSTLSQLGFMVFSISLGYWCFCFIHMMGHAFFKSSLFLSTGNLMHYLFGDQDSRNFGSLGISFFSKLIFFMSCLSLVGFPFSLGFYSKDTILSVVGFNFSSFVGVIFLISCFFTVAYSVRLIETGFFAFVSSPSFECSDSINYYVPMIILFVYCIFSGNFLFFYFFPVLVFSFFDFMLGCFVILSGVILSFYKVTNYDLSFMMVKMGFLFFFSFVMSSFSYSLEWKNDFTWGEVMGGSGVVKILSYFSSLFFTIYSFLFMVPHLIIFVTLIYFFTF
nr:NADH dehydrogenase subunit 5 [Scatoglyphus polytrematus]